MKKINDQKKQKKFLKPKSNDDKERIKKKERELEEYLNRLTEEDRIWEQYQSDNVFNIDFVDDEYFSVHDITTVDISEYLIDGYIKYINNLYLQDFCSCHLISVKKVQNTMLQKDCM